MKTQKRHECRDVIIESKWQNNQTTRQTQTFLVKESMGLSLMRLSDRKKWQKGAKLKKNIFWLPLLSKQWKPLDINKDV